MVGQGTPATGSTADAPLLRKRSRDMLDLTCVLCAVDLVLLWVGAPAGMVQCGMAGYGYGMVLHGMGMVWYGLVCGTEFFSTVWYGRVGYRLVCGTVFLWYVVRYYFVWYGMVWYIRDEVIWYIRDADIQTDRQIYLYQK